jgi:hypothetical protein
MMKPACAHETRSSLARSTRCFFRRGGDEPSDPMDDDEDGGRPRGRFTAKSASTVSNTAFKTAPTLQTVIALPMACLTQPGFMPGHLVATACPFLSLSISLSLSLSFSVHHCALSWTAPLAGRAKKEAVVASWRPGGKRFGG